MICPLSVRQGAYHYLSFSISTDEIIAFGDDYSDIGILKISGVGIAMGNTIEDVKQISDVVIGSNDDNGIAEYLNHLIEKN